VLNSLWVIFINTINFIPFYFFLLSMAWAILYPFLLDIDIPFFTSSINHIPIMLLNNNLLPAIE
jgi:hypothetical protein